MECDIEYDEDGMICLKDNGKIFYTIVQREPELKYTGLSIIKRILKNRHQFIGDFYSTQSHFCIKYIDEDNIKLNDSYAGSNRNELSDDELDEIIDNEEMSYVYVYDVSLDSLLIKEKYKPSYFINFHNRADVEEFIEEVEHKYSY